ncbi:hypothetical protein MED121_02805 [Marinomonas sp. MED121]|nr:hypothetical protein MED121_02805 [Marinomonas sp. MED121]
MIAKLIRRIKIQGKTNDETFEDLKKAMSLFAPNSKGPYQQVDPLLS